MLFLIIFVSCSKNKPRQAILILLDAARPDHFSFSGYERSTTPEMDALAAQGVWFQNCFTQGTHTRSALPCLIYSRYYAPAVFPYSPFVPLYNPGELFQDIDREGISIPRLLEKNGFLTAAISAHDYLNEETRFAKEFMIFNDLMKGEKNLGKTPYPRAEKVVDHVLQWIKDNKNRDYFLYIHIMDTHFPHFFEEDAHAFFGDKKYMANRFIEGGWLKREDDYNEEDIRYLNALYDGSLRYTDRQIGRVVKYLKDINRLDSTLIMITADHGEILLELPGKIGHGGVWSEWLARIPLIVHYPAKVRSKIRKSLSEMVDIGPTLMELLEVEFPRGKAPDGTVLITLTEKEPEPSEKKVVMIRGAVRTNRYKCFFNEPDSILLAEFPPGINDLSGQLYDLEKDKTEQTDLFCSKPGVVLELLSLYREQMRPLYLRSEKARIGRTPDSPFALSSRHFNTDPKPLTVSYRTKPDELMKKRSPSGWFHSNNPDYDWIFGRQNAQPLNIEISIPDGRYKLLVDMNGACRMKVYDQEKLLRARPFSHKLPWQPRQIEFGWIEVKNNLFKASITLQSKRPWFGLRQLGFVPESSIDPKDPDYKKRMDRLRQLGYIK
jgi:arylsulfatase A-like enzyme